MQGKGSAERRMEDIMGYDTETRERLHHANPRASGGKLEGGREVDHATATLFIVEQVAYRVSFSLCRTAMEYCRAQYEAHPELTHWLVTVTDKNGDEYHYTQPQEEKRGRSDAEAIAEALDLLEEANLAVLRLAKRLREREAF